MSSQWLLTVSGANCTVSEAPTGEADAYYYDDGVQTYVGWDEFARIYLMWPAIVQLGLTPGLFVLKILFTKYIHILDPFIEAFVGTEAQPVVKYPQFMVACYLLQLGCSLWTVWFFGERVKPPHDVKDYQLMLEQVFAFFFAFHYFVSMLRSGFQWTGSWSAGAIIDIFTIVPVLVEKDPPFISLAFLRAYHALLAFDRFSAVLDKAISEFQKAVALMILRLIALVVIMGGTVFVLEVLGEPPLTWLQDRPVTTAMGDLSMVQMFYWIVTTISTVGYGDFSPTTVPSRLVVSVFILSGVVFFTVETNSLLELSKLLGQGRGAYRQGDGRDHVVVVGAAVGRNEPMVQTFLEEILHSEHEDAGWPDVIILSEAPIDPALRKFVQASPMLPHNARNKVVLLVGSALAAEDLQRVQIDCCQLACVLPDMETCHPDAEDEANINRALAMQRHGGPHVPLRVVLCRPESKNWAVNAGIRAEGCCSANDLKANILAQSTRVHGFMTLLANLLRSSSDPTAEMLRSSEDMREYLHGVGHEIYGLCLKDEFDGQTFSELAAKAFMQYGVLLMAVQIEGRVMIAPMSHVCRKGDVVLCIAEGLDKMTALSATETKQDNWRTKFLDNRKTFLYQDGDAARVAQKALTSLGDAVGLKPGVGITKWTSEIREELIFRLEEGAKWPTTTPFQLPHFSQYGTAAQADAARRGVGPSGTKDDHVPDLPCLTLKTPRDSPLEDLSNEIVQAREYRQEMGQACITLIMAGQAAWQQVLAFLRPLRAPTLPFVQPVIVLTKQAPPEYIVDLYPQVGFVIGPITRADNLLRAGVLESCSVVILAGETKPGTSPKEVDSATLIMASIVEHLVVAFGRGSRFRMYEFRDDQSVLLLPESEEVKKLREQEVHTPKKKRKKAEAVPLKLQPRYLAGTIFTPDFFGTMVGRMYYLPATIELIEALAMPAKMGQPSSGWQTRVPKEFVGRSFGDLFEAFCRGQASKPALAIALYRPNSTGDNSYVFTCPPKATGLRQGDHVVWLGCPEFGKWAAEKGLLLASELLADKGAGASGSGAQVEGRGSGKGSGFEDRLRTLENQCQQLAQRLSSGPQR